MFKLEDLQAVLDKFTMKAIRKESNTYQCMRLEDELTVLIRGDRFEVTHGLDATKTCANKEELERYLVNLDLVHVIVNDSQISTFARMHDLTTKLIDGIGCVLTNAEGRDVFLVYNDSVSRANWMSGLGRTLTFTDIDSLEMILRDSNFIKPKAEGRTKGELPIPSPSWPHMMQSIEQRLDRLLLE
jgi:hypothetical protein